MATNRMRAAAEPRGSDQGGLARGPCGPRVRASPCGKARERFPPGPRVRDDENNPPALQNGPPATLHSIPPPAAPPLPVKPKASWARHAGGTSECGISGRSRPADAGMPNARIHRRQSRSWLIPGRRGAMRRIAVDRPTKETCGIVPRRRNHTRVQRPYIRACQRRAPEQARRRGRNDAQIPARGHTRLPDGSAVQLSRQGGGERGC